MSRSLKSKINLAQICDPFHPKLAMVIEKDMFFKIAHQPQMGVHEKDIYAVQKTYALGNKRFVVLCFYAFNDVILHVINVLVKIKPDDETYYRIT